jgi:DNA-binding transcriptional ArsR family regulator
MKSKGIVTSRRDGKNILYRLTNPKIITAFDIIKDILSQRLKSQR